MKLFNISLALALALATLAQAQTPPAAPAPRKLIVRGKDAPVVPVALWMENGKPMVLRGPDVKNAPATATHVQATIYNMDGPSFRRVSFPKGARFSPPANTADTLLYILKGRLKVSMGDVSGEVGPGDAFREVAGVLTSFEVLQKTELIETNIPAQAAK